MNSKQAKKLRKQALQIAVENNLPYVEYSFKQYQKVYTDITGKVVPYRVYTAYLEDSQRKLYKQLKKQFKEGK